MNKVITISREFGSGGREIGFFLAEELGVPIYDKGAISAPDDVRPPPELPEIKETYTPPFFNDSVFHHDVFRFYQQPTDKETFMRQTETIKQLAADEVCVIVGRCADFVLEQKAIRIFLYADMDFRVCRKAEYYPGMSSEKIVAHIKSIDRQRKSYYQRYTGQEWGSRYFNDICINTSYSGIDGAVKTILAYLFPPKY